MRCQHGGCDRAAKTKGFCKAHYNQFRQWGFTSDLAPPRTRYAECAEDGCGVLVPSKADVSPHCEEHRERCAVLDCEAPRSPQTVLCVRHKQLDAQHRSSYGIGLLDRLSEEAKSKCCPICGRVPGKLHLDHDHETGEHRDYLCGPCNRALGLMQDDPEVLRAAAAYIEKHRNARL